MKITFLLNGKTDKKYVEEGINIFDKRIKRYLPFQIITIPALKNTKSLSPHQQKEKESELMLKHFNAGDHIILLDEKGKEYSSIQFADSIQKQMNSGIKNLVFVVGGPYGFSDTIKQKANGKISLSRMTFSHQLIRVIFMEQLYRAMTILKNEPYHNE
ncbi:MAG: 23S rRNA (pseudouridine(1915)-N(3))-methyltransferase RlmH [Bacteroidota bacterium]|nr:23S rRNA (pseudouridine(1915)-N(3))-methyltransferase RlmH [Bacteroidota bacterium]